MTPMDHFKLWKRTLADQPDNFNPQREILRQAFLSFRERTAQLVGEISQILPGLTVHDITHLDALWRVADEIAGPDYPLNPAEAFVLGGAFLLHDAAHVLMAYDDGISGIKRTIEWKDLVAQCFENTEPLTGSAQEQLALFQVLRHLHAKQARQLAKQSWAIPGTSERVHLLEKFESREYYGDLIGEIAESHHWPAHRVADTFENRHLNAPSFLQPAEWSVDALKVAFLLRTADAAHIDGQRAPWFLFALRRPEGISQLHWKFQAKMGLPMRTGRNEIRLSFGSNFGAKDRQAWWLAYDTACMIDQELRDAQTLLRDTGRTPFTTTSVEHITSPEIFASNVRTEGWEPVNVAPKIGDIPKVIASLGGVQLYGNRPELALREVIQNAADAVRALRALGGIGPEEGEIGVALERDGDVTWLHVTDTGIGMSRYVLTEVLLDFGNSLWCNETLRTELPGLASHGFKAVGRFGIGFFSVFMLGRKVIVTTRRFSRTSNDSSDQWVLEFNEGLDERPALRRPSRHEFLKRPGTRISVALDKNALIQIQKSSQHQSPLDQISYEFSSIFSKTVQQDIDEITAKSFLCIVPRLCPTLDVKVQFKIDAKAPEILVKPYDWKAMESGNLLHRLYPSRLSKPKKQELIDLLNDSGCLLGRITYDRYVDAVITYGGLRSGRLPNLAGVVLGHNNLDLVRNESYPLAAREDWQRWAKSWLDKNDNPNVYELADMHPFFPERDLPVYVIGDISLNEAQLAEKLKHLSEVRICAEIDHEDCDDVSKDSFDRNLKLSSNILFLPYTDSKLAKALSFQPINYIDRLQKILRRIWGNFEEDWEEDVVGNVNGTEIFREVTCYVPKDSSTDIPTVPT